MYGDDYYNITHDDSIVDKKKTISLKMLDDLKGQDNGYYNTKNSSRRDVYNKIKHQVEMYSSGDRGTLIRDAITGYRYRVLVGSVDEDLFFKVKMCSGDFGNKEALTLFYSSPEDYQRHQKVDLGQEVKARWVAKKVLLESK